MAIQIDGDGIGVSALSTAAKAELKSGRKNLIINGGMRVAQRGTTETVTTNSSGYLIDRWRREIGSISFGSNIVFEQVADAPAGFKYSYKVTNTTGATQSPLANTDYFVLSNKPEKQDVQHLNWGTSDAKQITLSFWVKSSITGTWLEAGFRRDGTSGARSIYSATTINSSNTWEYKTITFPADTVDGWAGADTDKGFDFFFSIHGQVSGNTASQDNTWEAGNLLGGTQGTNTVFLETTGATLQITGVQLEVGDTATDFEHRSYGEELALCQRYYYMVINGGSQTLGGGWFYSPTSASVVVSLPVTMRTTPSVEKVTGTNYYRIEGGGYSTACSGNFVVNGGSARALRMYDNSSIGGGTSGHGNWWYSNNASSYVAMDAEL